MDIRHRYQVACADITYIPTSHGFLYLVAVMDCFSRCVLSWRLSNTMDSAFCVEALDEALAGVPRPEIFNTDQGGQFTSAAFTGRLEAAGVRVSMDGKGSCLHNIFIKRLWRSLKYEAVYLRELEDGLAGRRVIGGLVRVLQRHATAHGAGRTDAARSAASGMRRGHRVCRGSLITGRRGRSGAPAGCERQPRQGHNLHLPSAAGPPPCAHPAVPVKRCLERRRDCQIIPSVLSILS